MSVDRPFEVCPKCEALLSYTLYKSFDAFGNKIWRCRRCYTELVNSPIGWVIKG